MSLLTDRRLLSRLPKKLMSTASKRRKRRRIALFLAFTTIIILSILLTGIALAQEAEYPVPLLPEADKTEVAISSILFSWKPFYVATDKNDLESSKNTDMSDPIVQSTTSGGITTYQYTGTLEFGTTYWWRVVAPEPAGGDWSPVSSFTTKAAPAATDNITASKSSSNSFISPIIDYLEDLGWPMVGLIGGAIVIVIVAVVVLLKPKAKTPSERQRTQPPPGMQRPIVCPTCGSPNNPERRFCNNCGSSLITRGPQPWGSQQSVNCPTCGLPNTTGAKFCSRCGTGLVDRGPQQQWGPQPASACPTCGSPIHPDQKFCTKCGASLTTDLKQQSWQLYQTFTCPICGTNINKGRNPCPSCNTWLDWGA